MMYSYRIEQAIRAASILHHEQVRRGPAPYPYVVHLFATACILADYTNDEDIIIAGLLHDSLEDTDYRPRELGDDFGTRVREIVEGITDPEMPEGEEGNWKKKKQAYLDHIKESSSESLLVATADKIHNLRSIVEGYQDHIDDFIADFGGTLEDRVTHYQKMSNLLNRKIDNEIIHEFNHVFDEYKKFVEHVQKNTT